MTLAKLFPAITVAHAMIWRNKIFVSTVCKVKIAITVMMVSRSVV